MTSPFFLLGIKGADEDELREMASAPYEKHVYNVANFDQIDLVQKKIIAEVCSGVDDQLSSLVSGEESKLRLPYYTVLVVVTRHPMASLT